MQSSEIIALDLFKDIQTSEQIPAIISKLNEVARGSVRSSANEGLIIAYSGGIDSSILAILAVQTMRNVVLLSLGAPGSRDVDEIGQNLHNLNLQIPHFLRKIGKDRIEQVAMEVSRIVEVESVSHFEDCVAFYLIAEEVRDLGKGDVIASANGPDELFCGYDRFRRILAEAGYEGVKEEIINSLESANKLRAQVKFIMDGFGLRTVEPFLNNEFVEFSLNVATELKIARGDDTLRKRIWREYGSALGLPGDITMKRKKAMQYSMGIHKVILPMVKNRRIMLAARSHTE